MQDLDGDGLDDYLFVDGNGATTVYLNGGPQANANLGWIWIPQNGGNPIATGIGSTRAFVHFADIDGDGKADYLGVDPSSGAVTYYRNGGANPAAANGWLWIPEGQIATGIGEGGGVRFGDIDGDGRADYIWLSESGAATVYINKVGLIPQNWIALNNGNPVASGVGAYRQDIRFTDIDGDGKVDYVWIHPIDGSAHVWINVIGVNPANWIPLLPDPVAAGVGYSGACIKFAYLEHTGRGGYVPVTPSTGAVAVWLNGCDDLAPSPSPSPIGGSPGTTKQPGTRPTGGTATTTVACTPVNVDDNQGEDGDNPATTTRATLPAPTTPPPPTSPTNPPPPSPTPVQCKIACVAPFRSCTYQRTLLTSLSALQ